MKKKKMIKKKKALIAQQPEILKSATKPENSAEPLFLCIMLSAIIYTLSN